MSLDINAIPNPPNSPIEKLLPDTLWENIEPRIRDSLSENPTKDEILRAFSYYDRVMADYIQRHERQMTYWANIHTHGGVASGENVLALPDVWTDVSGLTDWDARKYGVGTQIGEFMWMLPGPVKQTDASSEVIKVDLNGIASASLPKIVVASSWPTYWATNSNSFTVKYEDRYLYCMSRQIVLSEAGLAVFDIETETWTNLAASTDTGEIAHIEGFPYLWQNTTGGTLRRYDIAANTWTDSVENPPTPKGDCFTHGGYLYIYGGEVDGVLSPSLKRYDPVNDTWTFMTNAPHTTELTTIEVYGGKAYICDNGSNDRDGTFMAYTFSTDSWEVLTPYPGTLLQRAKWSTANFGAVGEDKLLIGDTYTYG